MTESKPPVRITVDFALPRGNGYVASVVDPHAGIRGGGLPVGSASGTSRGQAINALEEWASGVVAACQGHWTRRRGGQYTEAEQIEMGEQLRGHILPPPAPPAHLIHSVQPRAAEPAPPGPLTRDDLRGLRALVERHMVREPAEHIPGLRALLRRVDAATEVAP